MALKKAKSRKSASTSITVRVVAFNSKEQEVTLRRGSTLQHVIAQFRPPAFELNSIDGSVGGVMRENNYILNNGDVVALVPKVTGGQY